MALFGGKKKDLLEREIPTLISKGCSIKGDMNAGAIVRIDGRITGNVVIEEGLIVGEDGIIEGNIITKELVVHGSITGNISAAHIDIKSSGKIKGDISAISLVIESGGFYEGMTHINSGSGKPLGLIEVGKKAYQVD